MATFVTIIALVVIVGSVILIRHYVTFPTVKRISRWSYEVVTKSANSKSNFNWEMIEPLRLRPFKPIYYITMGLRSAPPSELIIFDKNYLSRIQIRNNTMRDHRDGCMGCLPAGVDAVRELYSYLLGDYLPTQYPSMFSKDESSFRNHVTQTTIPLSPPEDPIEVLKLIGETVEDDMFFLQKTSEGHQSIACLCTSPSGFDPMQKLGKLLKDIHAPVPSYEKIGPSMERHFGRVEVGKNSTRVNWSITTSPELFNVSTNHVHEEDEFEPDANIDISQARLRVELQTLSRLPKTGALLFSFKTHLYLLEDVKAEGLGPQVADAIDGLKTGNAPGMFVYKGAIRWGKSVCKYLRA